MRVYCNYALVWNSKLIETAIEKVQSLGILV